MPHNFGSLAFTPTVKALQERYGSRKQYARIESGPAQDRLGPDESAFIAEGDSFYMASLGSTGWPYVQHRGGPKGFLKVIDERTVAFADFRGNKQYISAGNFATDNRVALIMVDYPRQGRLKILGRVEVFETPEWIERVRMPAYQATIERVFVVRIEAFDWNCSQHITPRYTEEQIREVIEPLEQENKKLREELTQLRSASRAFST